MCLNEYYHLICCSTDRQEGGKEGCLLCVRVVTSVETSVRGTGSTVRGNYLHKPEVILDMYYKSVFSDIFR